MYDLYIVHATIALKEVSMTYWLLYSFSPVFLGAEEGEGDWGGMWFVFWEDHPCQNAKCNL